MTRARSLVGSPVAVSVILVSSVVVVLIALYVFQPRPYVTGGNGVRPLSFVGSIEQGMRLCAYDVAVPARTSGLRLWLAPVDPADTPTALVTLDLAGGERRTSRVQVSAFGRVDARFAELPKAGAARVCIRAVGGAVAAAGASGLQSDDRTLRINGESLDARLSILFLPREGAERSFASQLPEVLDRASLFRPGFITPTFLWVTLLVALPVALVASVVGVARGLQGRRAAALLALVAFVSAGSWAVMTVPFDSPDESEHFAYLQSVAERQTRPDSTPTAQGAYSTAHAYALEAVRHPTRIGGPDQRPPWSKSSEEAFRNRVTGEPLDNGGGYAEATRLHLPAYYALLLPGYSAGGDDVFAQLTFARLLSALLAIVVALCAFGIVRDLAPGRHDLALTAGVIVALHPMFSFIAGAVNNDMGVNAGAALIAYLGIRALRRPSPWVFGGFGAALALTPVLKATGLALWPPALIVIVGAVARHHQRREWAWAVAAVGSAFFATSVALRGFLKAVVEDGAQGVGSGQGAVDAGILGSLGGKLSYTWQVALPKLPFMQEHFLMTWPFYDIYVVRGWGAFGWYSFLFPRVVYFGLVALLAALLALGIWTLLRRHSTLGRWGWEVGFLLAIPIVVLTAISFAYYSPTPREIPGEQGRYLFTAAAPLAALSVGALLGLPQRLQRAAAVALVIVMAGLAFAGRVTYLQGVFT